MKVGDLVRFKVQLRGVHIHEAGIVVKVCGGLVWIYWSEFITPPYQEELIEFLEVISESRRFD